jgi:hypothetical protein
MKSLIFIATVVGLSIFLQSCKKAPNNFLLTDDYLPLEVGNYWQLDFTEKEEIIGTKTINGKDYFMLKYQNDTTYYREDNNKIFTKENETDEAIKFDFLAKVHDTWKYGLYNVTLVSKTDSIIINNQKVYNCYHFYFDVPVMVDEEHSIWLAPGIGFIQEECGECLHQIRKLDKAKIGGQDIVF